MKIKIVDNCDEPLFEMANIKKYRTMLPYDIWVDSMASERSGLPYDSRRIKVGYQGNWISIALDPPHEVKAGDSKKFRKLKSVHQFISKHLVLFELHYQQKIDDGLLIDAITYAVKNNVTDTEALAWANNQSYER